MTTPHHERGEVDVIEVDTGWSLEAAVEHVRGARDAYAQRARDARLYREQAVAPPSWWPRDDEHSHATLTARVDRFEHAHALACACLADLEAIRRLASEHPTAPVA